MPLAPIRAPIAAVFALLALAPPAGAASALEQYQRTGRIDPCTASSPGGIPNDVEQYAPDFLEALRDAQKRGCDRGSSTARSSGEKAAAGAAPAPRGPHVPEPPAPPPAFRGGGARHLPLASGSERRVPAPVIALGIMVLLGLGTAGAVAIRQRTPKLRP